MNASRLSHSIKARMKTGCWRLGIILAMRQNKSILFYRDVYNYLASEAVNYFNLEKKMRVVNVILNEETCVSLDYMPEVGDHVIAMIHDENGMQIEVSGWVTEIL